MGEPPRDHGVRMLLMLVKHDQAGDGSRTPGDERRAGRHVGFDG